jgi:hypothetical protein
VANYGLADVGDLPKDLEKSIASAETWIIIAHIRIVFRPVARYYVY